MCLSFGNFNPFVLLLYFFCLILFSSWFPKTTDKKNVWNNKKSLNGDRTKNELNIKHKREEKKCWCSQDSNIHVSIDIYTPAIEINNIICASFCREFERRLHKKKSRKLSFYFEFYFQPFGGRYYWSIIRINSRT